MDFPDDESVNRFVDEVFFLPSMITGFKPYPFVFYFSITFTETTTISF